MSEYDYEDEGFEHYDEGFEPTEGFGFTHVTIGEDGEEEQDNSRLVVAEHLCDVLSAFAQFLRESGFDYVESLDANCGGVIWSSAEVE